jgi:hypothetical protein
MAGGTVESRPTQPAGRRSDRLRPGTAMTGPSTRPEEDGPATADDTGAPAALDAGADVVIEGATDVGGTVAIPGERGAVADDSGATETTGA